MGKAQAPGELNGNVQDTLQRLLGPAFVKSLGVDPRFEVSSFHTFGKHTGNTAQVADVETARDVRM